MLKIIVSAVHTKGPTHDLNVYGLLQGGCKLDN